MWRTWPPPPARVVIFNEALVHGTLPWRPADRMRRSILFKYSPGFMSWGSPHGNCPIADPTPEEEAIYQDPRRTGRTALGQGPATSIAIARTKRYLAFPMLIP